MQPLLAALLCLTSLALLACSTPTPAEPEAAPPAAAATPAPPDTFEPSPGVICDRDREVCEFRGGASVGLTRLFFGDPAGDAAEAAATSRAYPHDPIFVLPDGAICDTRVTTCYTLDTGASDEVTGEYFGPKAVERLATRRAEVARYGDHVACDRGSQICYDRFGASVGITHVYIGAEASEALLPRLKRD